MNEAFIFFEIRGMFKKSRDWSNIYHDGNERWRNGWFSSKYVVCSKSTETEAVFTKTEMNK